MYWVKHMSSYEIVDHFKFNSPFKLLRTIFKHLGIPVKTLSQAIKESVKMGRKTNSPSQNQYKSAHHMTWDNKDVFLRSSYEKDYADYLDDNKILYDVEALNIVYYDSQQHTERTAIPDFYLIETNTIVEIKSCWTLDIINMIDKVKAYKEKGYNFKLILDHKDIDLYSLLEQSSYKFKNREHSSLRPIRKTKIGNRKWKWMNDGNELYKVPVDEIEEYLKNGFILGVLKK